MGEWIIKAITYTLIALMIIGISFQACERFNQHVDLPNDHPLEEAIEDVIEHHTGIELDLTPNDK